MSKSNDEQMRQWLSGWQAAGPVLKRLRREAIIHSDTAEAIEWLSDAFESALLHSPQSNTSGLVEQQSLFKKSRP